MPRGAGEGAFRDVWARNFLNVFAAPLTIAEYLAGLVRSSIATSLVGLAVMLLLATTLFGLSFLAYGPALVPILLVLFLFGVALGISVPPDAGMSDRDNMLYRSIKTDGWGRAEMPETFPLQYLVHRKLP